MKQCTGIQWGAFSSLILIISTVVVSAQGRNRWEDSLTLIISTSQNKGLPVEALENKIKEGRAKQRTAKDIYSAVRTRQALLSKIKEEHRGTVPGGYMRELFNHERSTSQKNETSKNPVKSAHATISNQHNTSIKKSLQNKKKHITIPHKKKETDLPSTVKRQKSAEKKIEKQLEKTEKKMDKASSRAQRRMKNVEKRMHKSVQKRRGFKK